MVLVRYDETTLKEKQIKRGGDIKMGNKTNETTMKLYSLIQFCLSSVESRVVATSFNRGEIEEEFRRQRVLFPDRFGANYKWKIAQLSF